MNLLQYGDGNRGLLAIVLASAVPTLSFFLFGPFTIFGGNVDEFESGFFDLLLGLLPLAVGIWAVLISAGLVLKLNARECYLWIVLISGTLIWAQSTFLMHDYGVLDGRGLDWQSISVFARLDFLLWIGIPLLVFAFRKRLKPLLVPAALVIIGLQLIGAYETSRSGEIAFWSSGSSGQEPPPEALFHYSPRRNIIHIVLDNFQTEVFAELVAEEGLETNFDGFTLFTDNASAAPDTSLAIPSILLGRTFDGTTPASSFYQEAAESGLPSRLHDLGYRVNLSLMLPQQGGRHSAAYRIPNTIDQSPGELAWSEAVSLLDVMLFRASPHLARGWVYNDNNWRIRRFLASNHALSKSFVDRDFLRRYTQSIQVMEEPDPAYHFIHLWPPHPPYMTRADGTPAGKVLPNTRENYRHEARATLYAVIDLFESLKEHDLYDNSLIVLQSDHGGAFEPDFSPPRMFTLLAVKPRDSHGAMTASRAQTSVTDIAATIIEQEGLDIDWPGESVLTVSETQARVRYYAMFSSNNTLRIVRIDGPLNSPDSYVHTDKHDLVVQRPIYQYGTVANVGLEGNAGGYLDSGWSTPFPNIVWNNGHEATLKIPIKPSNQALDLTLWVIPSIHGENWPRQRITLHIDQQIIESWELTRRESTKLRARIPSSLTNTDELLLNFSFPDAVRQRDIGVGQDRRLQAMALGRFHIEESKETD